MPLASIDVHAHALPQSYADAMAALGVSAVEEDGFPTPEWSEESHLQFIDETNQAFSILTISTPHIHRGDDELSARLARTINDDLAAICHRLTGISRVLIPAGLMEPIDVMGNLRSLYWDVAGDARPVMLEGLMKIADPTHLLYGSDMPYTPVFAIAENKEGLAGDHAIAPIVEDVFFNNAARLYGLSL